MVAFVVLGSVLIVMTSIPPVPLRARNRGTPAHLANARIALKAGYMSVVALILIVIGIVLFILLFG